MLTARMLLLSLLCLETHSHFTADQWEYVRGLSHNQRIQTFRRWRRLVFACDGLDLWGWIHKCVGGCLCM